MLRILCIVVACFTCLQSPAFAETNRDYGYASFAASNGSYALPNCVSQHCYNTISQETLTYSIPTDFGAVAFEYHDKELFTGDWVNVQSVPLLRFNTDYIRAIGKRMDVLAGVKLGFGGIKDYCGGVSGSCTGRFEMDYGVHLGLNTALTETENWVAKLDLNREFMREPLDFYDGLGQTAVMTSTLGLSYYFNYSNEITAYYSLMSYSTLNDQYSIVLSNNALQAIGLSYAYHFDTKVKQPSSVRVDY